MRRFAISTLMLCAGISALAVAAPANAQNLLTNGDFELGNTPAGNSSFITDYQIGGIFPGEPDGSGRYRIVRQATEFNPVFGGTFGDHTTGTGFMMLVNGFTEPNKTFWGQDIAVVPNFPYEFRGWFASAMVNPDPSPASIALLINDTVVGNLNVGPTVGAWTQMSFAWDSGPSTLARIRLQDTNLTEFGNDFVVDDLSFIAAPEPGTLALLGLAALPLGMVLRRRK